MKQLPNAPAAELTLDRSSPDVNNALIELVRLLTRRAAREWHRQEIDADRQGPKVSETVDANAAL